jgi:hypothetical protein
MILRLCWAQVAERGVETTGVVDVIDKAWKIGGDVFESSGASVVRYSSPAFVFQVGCSGADLAKPNWAVALPFKEGGRLDSSAPGRHQ